MVGAGSAQRARHSLGQWIRETRAAGKAPGLSPPRDGTTTLGAREGGQGRTFLSLPHHRHTPALLLSVWTSEVRLCLERRVCRFPGTGEGAETRGTGFPLQATKQVLSASGGRRALGPLHTFTVTSVLSRDPSHTVQVSWL
nr:uncharacterized protein LOC123282473 isoform X1 [Equus asinus]